MAYGRAYRALVERVPISFATLAGIIRCAHKYQADDAANWAGKCLIKAFERPYFYHATPWKGVWKA